MSYINQFKQHKIKTMEKDGQAHFQEMHVCFSENFWKIQPLL